MLSHKLISEGCVKLPGLVQGLQGSFLPGDSPTPRFSTSPDQFSRLPGGMRVVGSPSQAHSCPTMSCHCQRMEKLIASWPQLTIVSRHCLSASLPSAVFLEYLGSVTHVSQSLVLVQDDPDSRVLAEWQQVLRARQEAAHAVEAANVSPCPAKP